MSKFFNQLNNIKAGRAKVRAYGEGGTVDALEAARDYLKEKYNNPEAGIPTKVATVLGLLPVNLARSAARAVTAPTRSMTDENFNPEEEAANMAGFITTGGIGLSKAGLGPKGDVLGMGVGGKRNSPQIIEGDYFPDPNTHRGRMAIQGGPLAAKPKIDQIIATLENHGMDWKYSENGGITAYADVVGPNGKVFKEGKHFNDKTSLRTLRNWLGYASGGAVHQRALGAKLFGLK